ncbi:MAG: hypothetical protein FWC73_07880 [Defluviitaleaceae bacterium]|nr:hypothetical protein [Defluviitaleaceae bacterium]
MLQLCTSQQIDEIPYTFQGTGIQVFSIEEALYHVYHYWRESAEEFSSERLISWVGALGLAEISVKITALAEIESFSKGMLAFLGLIEYFDKTELSRLKSELTAWENRLEWERLKDRGDGMVSRGQPAKALPLYTKALGYAQNAAILNNMAIANMQLGNHDAAVSLLAKACMLEPDNEIILWRYGEALILKGDYDTAAQILPISEAPEIVFLKGLMAYRQRDYVGALRWLTNAKDDPDFRISQLTADIHVELGETENALAVINPKDPAYHEKTSKIYASHGHANMGLAISHMKKAIESDQNTTGRKSSALWTKLASCYRTDYDWQRAAEAITNAMPPGADPSPATLLEYARIKKGQGHMRDYRAVLGQVLGQLKEEYRLND